MENKCSACGAPLMGRKCDYCGAKFGKSTANTGSFNTNQQKMEPADDFSTNNRRPLTIALSVVLVLVLIGVGLFVFFSSGDNNFGHSSNRDPFELLERSHQAMEELDSMQMDFDMDIAIDAGFMSMTLPMTGSILVEGENAAMEMSGEVMGEVLHTSAYFRNGYLYSDDNGHRTREMMNFDVALNDMVGPFFNEDLFDRDVISEAEATRVRGGYRLEFIINPDFILDAVPEFANDLAMTNIIDSGDFSIVIYLDNNYRQTSSAFNLEMSYTEMGMTATVSIDMHLELTQVGNITVTFPSWIDNFVPTTFVEADENTPFLGHWDNGSGPIFLWVFDRADEVEFLLNGTVIITQDGDERIETWALTSDDLLVVDGREFTWRVIGDRLTITDSHNDSWTFNRGAGGEPANVPNTEPTATSSDDLADHALIGEWDNGSGRIFLFVFRRADAVEFRDNGTVIITENNTSQTVDWEPDGPGAFTADGRSFTYTVRGDVLTITDSANDDWTFDRVE